MLFSEMFVSRSDLLKYSLRRDYPQLQFHKPARRNVSEMVFSEVLSATDFIDTMSTSSSTTETESGNDDEAVARSIESETEMIHEVYNPDTKSTLYSAGVIVQQALKETPGMTTPWPPLATDLSIDAADKVVPLELYNLIAWCVGASEEPVLDKKKSRYMMTPTGNYFPSVKILCTLQRVLENLLLSHWR